MPALPPGARTGNASVDATARLAQAAVDPDRRGRTRRGAGSRIWPARVGVTERHLRRVFLAEFGVAPVGVRANAAFAAREAIVDGYGVAGHRNRARERVSKACVASTRCSRRATGCRRRACAKRRHPTRCRTASTSSSRTGRRTHSTRVLEFLARPCDRRRRARRCPVVLAHACDRASRRDARGLDGRAPSPTQGGAGRVVVGIVRARRAARARARQARVRSRLRSG